MRGLCKALIVGTVLVAVGCGNDLGGTPPVPDMSQPEDTTPIPTPDAGNENPDRPAPPPPPSGAVDVGADITEDTTWTATNVYTLKQHVFVTGGTLTIEAGTQIKGEAGSSLVVTSDARLDAAGTAGAPIVFTSSRPVGQRMPGDWGGVVLLGKAPINVAGGSEKVEGFPASETRTGYGGNDPAHDCGRVRYVRIEFAGFELAPDNELNGLTLGGCGSTTEVDYVQVHRGADDGIEVFGGTVNLKHVLVTQTDDDGLDWDFGWQGKVQFMIIQQSAISGNNAIEADNNKNANDAEPRSNPTLYNLTLIGSGAAPGMAIEAQKGMLLRRGTAATIRNLVMSSFADFPIDIDGAPTVAQAQGGGISVRNAIFFDNGNQATWQDAMDNDDGFDEGTFFKGETSNMVDMDPMLMLPMDRAQPKFIPMTGSPCLDANRAAAPPADGFFDPAATFLGAIGDTDWTAGWTAYPEN